MLAVKSHETRNDVLTCCGTEMACGVHDTTTCCRFRLVGLRRLVFKSDQEPAIFALNQAVRESIHTVEFVMESPVEEHQSNGTIEVTVREIQKQVRMMKSALEERIKCDVPSRHPILAFLVEHAGRMMSRCQVGRDGRTSTTCMLASRTADSWLISQTSVLMPIRPGGARQATLDPKWQDGAFIGIRDRSDEMLIMKPSGVYKTRNVRRRTELERWDFEFLTTLWSPNPAAGHFPQKWQSRCQHPHQSLRSWWRWHQGTVQRGSCASKDPMCRKMATA